jgi:hypothetical protein
VAAFHISIASRRESWPDYQMALDIEAVVDGCVSGDETLGGLARLKALHLALSSSQGLM